MTFESVCTFFLLCVAMTAAPSVAPTAMPTIPSGAVDCRSACDLYTSTVTNVISSQLLGSVVLPTHFTLSFEILNPTFPSPGVYYNIMDLIDTSTGSSYLSVAMTHTGYTRFMYRGNIVYSSAAHVFPATSGMFTIFTITVQPNSLSIATNADISTYINSPPPAILDNLGRVFYLYFSNYYENSASGQFRNIAVRGMFLILSRAVLLLFLMCYLIALRPCRYYREPIGSSNKVAFAIAHHCA